jgi:hypothetical protein
MKKNQSGFSIVEGLLILVIVGILGGTGWYVWNSNKKANDLLNSADKSSNVTATPNKKKVDTKDNKPVDTKTFTDKTTNVSFSYPDGWDIVNNGDPSHVGYLLNMQVSSKDSGSSLVFSLTVRSKDAADAKFEPGGSPIRDLSSTEAYLQKITANDSEYALVGLKQSTDPGSATYEIGLKKCQSEAKCNAYIQKGDGSITVLVVNKQGHGAPIDTQSNEYSQMKSIISSLKF